MDSTDTYRFPGQLIQELLDARGWTQRILAVVLGIDETGLNKILAGKRSLDAPTALAIASIFNIEAEVLLSIQKNYDLALARLVERPNPGLASRAKLFGDLPVAEMVKRGWLSGITDIKDVPRLEQALANFFGVPEASNIEAITHRSKKTDEGSPATLAQLAWLHRVRQLAEDMLVPSFTDTGLQHAVGKLKELLVSPQSAQKASRILAECGVRFVVVEALHSTKIDGVCLWLDQKSPVIGLSLRFDRIDNFWFVLRHEIEHVLRGHGLTSAKFDIDMEKDQGVADEPEEERIANAAAADFCVPQDSLERFIARKAPFFAERDLLGFSKTIGVHPGLVAGQLQRRIGRYDLFRSHLVKIRSIVKPGTTVDGWGDVAPIG